MSRLALDVRPTRLYRPRRRGLRSALPPSLPRRNASEVPMPKPDHLDRTAHEVRQPGVFSARITSSSPANASANVKTFTFAIDPLPRRDNFDFKPGQWLDVHIPGVPVVGGFSLISSPSPKGDRFELAAKDSRHPPAAWFHAQDRVGAKVDVRVGGGFAYPPPGKTLPPHDEIVFIKSVVPSHAFESNPLTSVSGGVGLNPTLSILRWLKDRGASSSTPRTRLLYSSKPQDLLFLDVLPTVIDPSSTTLFLTGPSPIPPLAEPFKDRRPRRMALDDVVQAAAGDDEKVFYVCGPPQMTDDVVRWLRTDCRVDDGRVFSEKWW